MRFPYRCLIAAAFLCGNLVMASQHAAAQDAAAKKPNILVIWGDDIGIHNLSAYSLGVMGYHTPNIDRIAKEGALFTDARRLATRPTSIPALRGGTRPETDLHSQQRNRGSLECRRS